MQPLGFLLLLPWVFVAVCASLQLQRVGAPLCCGAWAPHCSGLSCCGAQALGTWAQQVRLRGLSLQDMWDLPRSGIRPMSPALVGRFLTTGPPGKSHWIPFFNQCSAEELLSCFQSFTMHTVPQFVILHMCKDIIG